MANVKITDMTDGAPADGTEILATSKAAAPRRITVSDIKTYIIDQIEAISAAVSTTGADSLFLLQGGALKPVDIDVVVQYVLDDAWGKAAEASPAAADTIQLYDSSEGAENVCTLANLATYIRGAIEATILDISDLADGSGALALTDYMLVTQGTTGKQITVQDVSDLIYNSLATHVTGKSDIGTPVDTDYLYLVRGSTGYFLNMDDLKTYVQAGLTLSGSGTTGFLAHWSDANTLAATYSVTDGAAGFAAGDNSSVPTTAAVRKELDEVVNDEGLIGEALADDDDFLVYNTSLTVQAKSAMSRVWTYITTKIQALAAKTAPVGADILTIQDSADSNNLKEATVANITKGLDISAVTDIGAALVDADEVLVDDGATGTTRSSALSRFWTYIESKLQAVTTLVSYSWFLDEDAMTSNDATKVPSQQSVKAYADLKIAKDGTDALTADWDAGAFEIRAEGFRADADTSGIASTTSITGVTDTPTTDPGWTSSSTVDMNAPDGYIKAYVGTQAVVIPYWNT